MLTVPERIARRVLNAQGLASRFIATRAGRLHVLDGAGSGHLPPIVLLHGLSANAICYGGLLRKLAPFTRRLIAPDMPAHGFSDVPAAGLDDSVLLDSVSDVLDRVLAETGEPAILLGNSLGGLVSIRYAQSRPDRIAGLVLVSPGGAPMPPATPTPSRSSTTSSPTAPASSATRSPTGSASGSPTPSCAASSTASTRPRC
jgi:pimeloyl-ACP methyl ester carboxylesterase